MRYMKIAVCLAAIFAIAAVATAVASAEAPSFSFPAEGGAKPGFTSVSGEMVLTLKNGIAVKCTSDTDSGEVVPDSDKVEDVSIVFEGCTAKIMNKIFKCTTIGFGEGVIKTDRLDGNLGYITKIPLVVGLVLKAEEEGGLFTEFTCTFGVIKEKVKVRGETIETISPLNELREPGEPFDLDFTATANPWEPRYKSLIVLGELEDELVLQAKRGAGGEYEGCAIETQDELYFLEDMEIIA